MKGMTRKLGWFYVAGRYFEGMRPAEGASLFVGMVVLEVQRDIVTDEWRYVAAHEHFRELPIGEILPEYRAHFSAHLLNAPPTWVEVKR